MDPPHSSEATHRLAPPTSPADPRGVALVARLAGELAERWRKGECTRAEELLNRHRELWDQPRAAVRLVYEEICLRHEYGQEMAPEEVLRRFPQWQAELRALVESFRQLQPTSTPPAFPKVGESLADFKLMAELGRGHHGRVFLAVQPSLADRPVVIKLSPCDDREHLTLARLQHTHIVPLFSVQDFPRRGLRALCMPYLGSATWAGLLSRLHDRPVAQRTGKHLLEALDQVQAEAPVKLPSLGPGRQFLDRASYVQAVCWVAAALADALHYAHQRGLVHLDLKPTNVLLTADSQPMLLDFHVAREPMRAGSPPPDWFGGTVRYMSPEQWAAYDAVSQGANLPIPVDGRSDIYSLGLLFYDALGGAIPPRPEKPLPPIRHYNPQVSVGLADLIHKCLAQDPNRRYHDAQALATDLRRHLRDLPLRGVPNRSPRERWRKWRRRRPAALLIFGLLLGILLAFLGAGAVVLAQVSHRLHEAEAALADGQRQLDDQNWAEAVRTLSHGLDLMKDLPVRGTLRQELERQLGRSRRAESAHQLHILADHLRFLYGEDSLSGEQKQELENSFQAVWATRAVVMDRSRGDLGPDIEGRIRTDLLDLATLWTDIRLRQGNRGQADEGLKVLVEAETLFGPSPVLQRERQRYAKMFGPVGEEQEAASAVPPRDAWEHYSLGRFLLQSGKPDLAAAELDRAVDMQPRDFWPHFYQGMCAYRLRHFQDAIHAFDVCVALSPDAAECYYNRGLAHADLGETKEALDDLGHALRIQPGLGTAALKRGTLHYQQNQYADAATDLQYALEQGADPATVHYNLALVHLARHERPAALASLQRALQSNPDHKEARSLLEKIQREP